MDSQGTYFAYHCLNFRVNNAIFCIFIVSGIPILIFDYNVTLHGLLFHLIIEFYANEICVSLLYEKYAVLSVLHAK